MSKPDIKFEWDEKKNTINMFRHGIDFMDAIHVWSDPMMQERYDILHSRSNEDRWQVVGLSKFGVLMVVYTDKVHIKESEIRIVSARKATSYELRQYQAMTFASNGGL